MRLLLLSSLATSSAYVGFSSSRYTQLATSYDEALSAQYIWMAQVTDMDAARLKNWTCGLACQEVKDVHSARVTEKGFPLDTRGLVARYGIRECIIAFRGSKTFMNYLLDDGNFIWTEPYHSCAGCKVHKGFYDSWKSLAAETIKELAALGCDSKPIRLTGHSLGAAMAVLAFFDLRQNYSVKHVYTYGQPRVGNQAWIDAFESRLEGIPYFRVVDYKDPVPRLPPRDFLDESGRSCGYRHPGPEVFYNATRIGSYHICPGGEDANCSDQYPLADCIAYGCCHCSYLGMNPCDKNVAAPQCIEPSSSVIDQKENQTAFGGAQLFLL